MAGARRLLENALEVYTEVGNATRAASVSSALASILTDEGHLQEAIAVLERSLTTLLDFDNRDEAAIVLNELGYNLYSQGRFDEAIQRYSEALVLFDENREKMGAAIASTNIAEIFYVRGDFQQAQEMHQDALAINREIGDRAGIAYDTYRLGKVFAAQGDSIAARRKLEEALAMQADEPPAAAQTQLELASLDLMEGAAESAVALAREAEEVLRTQQWNDAAAVAGSVLARALLADERIPEAQRALARAETLAEESQDRRVRLVTAIAAAQLRATSMEQAAEAVKVLEQLSVEAFEAGYLEEHFEAWLAAGKIEMAAGRTFPGNKRLADLESEARGHGFGLIADRAEAASEF